MRISTTTMAEGALQQLQDRLVSLQRSHNQLSTGKRILRPSDDVSGTVRAMGLHSGIRSLDQAGRNADDGLALTRAADDTLQSMMERLQRARQLAVEGANAIASGGAIAAEMESIEEDLVALANTRYQGRGLFSGTSGSDAIGGTIGARTYDGNAGAVRRRIGEDLTIQINVTADDVLGIGTARDTLATVSGLVEKLRSGDHGAVGDAIADLDAAMDLIGDGLSRVGSAGRRIEASKDRLSRSKLDALEHVSQIEDADLAETVMNLQLEQATYEAALNAFGRTMQLSMTNFLR